MNEKFKTVGALAAVAALGALAFEGVKFGAIKGMNLIKEHNKKKEEVKTEEDEK